ncbi:hypothetical protein BC826DRAFT_276540 [Russula brevipes]|nr:hypothetical protein BC826DRAFT_276540 [Russula brevipes]
MTFRRPLAPPSPRPVPSILRDDDASPAVTVRVLSLTFMRFDCLPCPLSLEHEHQSRLPFVHLPSLHTPTYSSLALLECRRPPVRPSYHTPFTQLTCHLNIDAALATHALPTPNSLVDADTISNTGLIRQHFFTWSLAYSRAPSSAVSHTQSRPR